MRKKVYKYFGTSPSEPRANSEVLKGLIEHNFYETEKILADLVMYLPDNIIGDMLKDNGYFDRLEEYLKDLGNEIIIMDWTGRTLYEGHYGSDEVDKVLDANRCQCDNDEDCPDCSGTGYWGDFSVYWLHPEYRDNADDNVYEYINY